MLSRVYALQNNVHLSHKVLTNIGASQTKQDASSFMTSPPNTCGIRKTSCSVICIEGTCSIKKTSVLDVQKFKEFKKAVEQTYKKMVRSKEFCRFVKLRMPKNGRTAYRQFRPDEEKD